MPPRCKAPALHAYLAALMRGSIFRFMVSYLRDDLFKKKKKKKTGKKVHDY